MRLNSKKTLLIELKSLESVMVAVVVVQWSDDIVLLNAWWLYDCMWPLSPMWVVQSWWVKVALLCANAGVHGGDLFSRYEVEQTDPNLVVLRNGLLITIFQGNSVASQFSFVVVVVVVQIKRSNATVFVALPSAALPNYLYYARKKGTFALAF